MQCTHAHTHEVYMHSIHITSPLHSPQRLQKKLKNRAAHQNAVCVHHVIFYVTSLVAEASDLSNTRHQLNEFHFPCYTDTLSSPHTIALLAG